MTPLVISLVLVAVMTAASIELGGTRWLRIVTVAISLLLNLFFLFGILLFGPRMALDRGTDFGTSIGPSEDFRSGVFAAFHIVMPECVYFVAASLFLAALALFPARRESNK